MIITKSLKQVGFGLLFFSGLSVGSNSMAGSLDPLTQQEIDKARQLVVSGPQADALVSPTDPSNLIETLLIERHAVAKGSEKSAARLVDVFTYDYGTNTLNQTVINLNDNSIVSVTHNKAVQLPLTENEINRAVDIVFNDEDELNLIKAAYQQVTGEDFYSPNQLEIKAFTFLGNSLPGVSNEEAMSCGNHRCAQVLFFTPEKIAFEISPVVDLSTKRIIQNISF